MAHREWSESTTANGALLPIPGWREIYKTNSSSSWTSLAEVDKDANVIVTSGNSVNPTTLVMMIFRADGVAGMYGGLVTASNNASNFISIYTSGSYGVMDLDGGNATVAGWGPIYGCIKAYSIHKTDYYYNQPGNVTYVAVSGNSEHKTQCFEVNYSSKTTSSLNSWVHNTIYNHTFAAITANTDPEWNWRGFSFAFEKNCTYSITVNSHCADNNWEGVVWFSSAKQVDPNDGNLGTIMNLGGLDYVKGVGYKTFEFTPTSNITYYFYLRSTTNGNVTTLRHASIKIVKKVKITLTKNGGTGGSSSVTLAPFTGYGSAVVTPPTKAGVSGIDYTFKGFFASIYSGSTQYIDSTGKIFGPDRTIRDTQDTSWAAVWGNTISYQPLTASIYAWCTPEASATSTTLNAKVAVANAPAKCASGESLSISYYRSGITNDSTGQYVNFPNGKATGPNNYYENNNIYLSSPNSSNYGYESESITRNIPRIYLSAVTVSTYGNITNTTISQYKDMPAAGITISTISDVRNYYTVNPTQTVTYRNGATRNGSVSCVLTKSISISSRGNIYEGGTKTNNLSGVKVTMNGEGSKTASTNITTAIQQPNVIEDVYVYTSPSDTNGTLFVSYVMNEAFDIYMGARYTSGETRDLLVDGPETGVSFGFTLPSFLTLSVIY